MFDLKATKRFLWNELINKVIKAQSSKYANQPT